jgi:DNA-directed RNA polymerase omega subunit
LGRLKAYSDLDSKFRFVILASKRAKQLLAGAKPKFKTTSKNLIQIAQKEVLKGLIKYEIVPPKSDAFSDSEEEVFIGEELGLSEEEIPDKRPSSTKKKDTPAETKKTKSKKA